MAMGALGANPDLYIRQVLIGPMANFVYFIGSKRTRECLIVDPAWDTDALLEIAEADGMTVKGALVTHYHPDHCGGSMMGFQVPGGIGELLGRVDGKVHVHKIEADGLKKVTGVSEVDLVRHESGDAVQLGDVKIELIHTPGHTPGSLCFLADKKLVAGDTLFVDGCGRVDLPGSSPEQMYETLTGTLAKLTDDIILLPGHDYGPTKESSLGEQRKTNRYLRMNSIEDWLRLRGG